MREKESACAPSEGAHAHALHAGLIRQGLTSFSSDKDLKEGLDVLYFSVAARVLHLLVGLCGDCCYSILL